MTPERNRRDRRLPASSRHETPRLIPSGQTSGKIKLERKASVSLRKVSLGVCVGLMALASGAAADERRVVVFQDGAKPSFVIEGDRFARGPVDLQVRLAGTNP